MVSPPEPEFQQAVTEIEQTLKPLFDKKPELKRLWQVMQCADVITGSLRGTYGTAQAAGTRHPVPSVRGLIGQS
jgi:hypothetical protein